MTLRRTWPRHPEEEPVGYTKNERFTSRLSKFRPLSPKKDIKTRFCLCEFDLITAVKWSTDPGIFWRILQHYKIGHFSTLVSYFGGKTSRMFTTDKKVHTKFWKSSCRTALAEVSLRFPSAGVFQSILQSIAITFLSVITLHTSVAWKCQRIGKEFSSL